MTKRTPGLVFGEVADAYDNVRAGYPPELADAVLAYLGGVPGSAVEVGAGTGKATEVFVARGVPVRCVEPDPQMAAVLRRRFPDVPVVIRWFEDWTAPPGGVDLLYSAMAWHWVDADRRWRLAHAALVPGGVVAIFAHYYRFADAAMRAAVHGVYAELAPELLDVDDRHDPDRDTVWFARELRGCGLFGDVRTEEFHRVVPYPTARYLALLNTFSNHRMVAEERRVPAHAAAGVAVDELGGVVDIEVRTFLALGRRT